jgi:hypothetical protein
MLVLAAGLFAAQGEAVAAPATAAPAASQTATNPVAAFDPRLQQAATAIDDGRYADALALVDQAMGAGAFAEHDGDWAAYLKSRALAATGQKDEAQKIIRERQREHPSYRSSSIAACMKRRRVPS